VTVAQQSQPDAAFVPTAAEGLPDGALDSAVGGACHLDARADTPYGRNVLAHALHRLQRDGWLKDTPVGRNDTALRPTARDSVCDACRCEDCGGTRAHHGNGRCTCPECAAGSPEYVCTAFVVPELTGLFAGQLALLLSAHLNQRAWDRCQAISHAAHHALIDYDNPGEPS
jgi:hypothetical protein